jgi:hypothetical protein
MSVRVGCQLRWRGRSIANPHFSSDNILLMKPYYTVYYPCTIVRSHPRHPSILITAIAIIINLIIPIYEMLRLHCCAFLRVATPPSKTKKHFHYGWYCEEAAFL